MKIDSRYLYFLFGILSILLTSCSTKQPNTNEFSTTNLITTISENTTTNESTAGDSLDLFYTEFTVESEDGMITRYRIAHIELYPTFDKMKSSTIGEFKYLELLSIENYSDMSYKYHFKDFFRDEIISVIFYKNVYNFQINNKYMIHIFPDNSNDFYWISDVTAGIFKMENNMIICHQKFSELFQLKVNSEADFIDIFLDNNW